MLPFRILIIGCCSAKPTLRHNPSAQVVNVHDQLFLVDCGEGTQRELIRRGVPMGRIKRIFISHLHGDHFYGLPGLLNTLALSDIQSEVHIHAFPELQDMLAPMLGYHKRSDGLNIVFHPHSAAGYETVFEDNAVSVTTLPLLHGVPCVGYVFHEKRGLPHIRPDVAARIGLPTSAMRAVKEGRGWTSPDGTQYPHEMLVTPSHEPRTYAYITDTRPLPELAAHIRGAGLLYHEATYASDCIEKALKYCHSTAAEAAEFAREAQVGKLLIGHYSDRYADETPLLQEARTIFPHTEAAQEGMVVEVS